MNLNFMSPLLFGVGAVALLAGLFLMQRLRVRHRTVVVPTTLFWKQAIDEAQARVFRDRFRHPLAYLLIASIALLIWLASSDLQTNDGGGHRHIILLDQGAAASHQQEWEAARALTEEQSAALPASSRWVYAVGSSPHLLLSAGESEVLLRHRLTDIESISVRSALREAMVALTKRHNDAERITFHIVGGGILDPDLGDELESRVEVRRLTSPQGLQSGNVGITAIGSGAAASGALSCTDVIIRLAGDRFSDRTVRIELNGESIGSVEEADAADGLSRTITARDLPATGGLLTARLQPGDALSSDDVAQLILPDLSPIEVFVDVAVPPALAAVVHSDPTLHQCAELSSADVVLCTGGDASVPRFVVAPRGGNRAAFQFTRETEADPDSFIEFVLKHLAVDEIDAMGLAQGLGFPVGINVRPDTTRRVSLWAELLAPDLDLYHSRALPIFVARSLRWLAGRESQPTFVTAGSRTALRLARFVGPTGRIADGITGGVSFPEAGVWVGAAGQRVAASVADPSLTSGAIPSDENTASILGGAGPEWLTILIVLALVLLGLEWFLLTRERIP